MYTTQAVVLLSPALPVRGAPDFGLDAGDFRLDGLRLADQHGVLFFVARDVALELVDAGDLSKKFANTLSATVRSHTPPYSCQCDMHNETYTMFLARSANVRSLYGPARRAPRGGRRTRARASRPRA